MRPYFTAVALGLPLHCSWLPVEGTGDTCRCCEARNCGQSQRTPFRWRGLGGRFQRDAAFMHGKFRDWSNCINLSLEIHDAINGEKDLEDKWVENGSGHVCHTGDDSTGNVETDLMVGPVILEAQKTSVHFPEDRRTEELIAKGEIVAWCWSICL